MSTPSCADCGRTVESDFEFCPGCGSELDFETCPECGAAIADDATECPDCGHDETCPSCGTLTAADAGTCANCGYRIAGRGPDADDVTEAVHALDAESQAYLTEAIRRDPALIEAWAQLVGIAPDPEAVPDDAPAHEVAIRSALDEAEAEQTAEQVTETLYETSVDDREDPITEDAEVPDSPDVDWVRDRLEELVTRGAIGRRETDGEVRYRSSVGAVLDDVMSLSSDKSLEDVDRVVEETGMNRAVVLRRNMNAQFTDLVVE